VISPVDGLVIVEKPTMPPGHCVASLTDEDREGFIDTLMTKTMIEERVYVSVSWIKEMASKLGMVDPDGTTDLDALHREVHDLREENKALNRQFSAIDVLESGGFQTRKRKGRPPAKKTQEK
jgi:hypothetical protein